MPSVILEIFPPAIAAVLITGAIAAMISTADSLLILSATELSENLLKKKGSVQDSVRQLMQSRMVTALLAFIALVMAYLSPSDLIYDLVGYVWAGIGGPFSIVILFTLFWKRFHGRAALLTIITGLVFTIAWIQTGMEDMITSRVTSFAASAVIAALATLFIPKARNAAGAAGSSKKL